MQRAGRAEDVPVAFDDGVSLEILGKEQPDIPFDVRQYDRRIETRSIASLLDAISDSERQTGAPAA